MRIGFIKMPISCPKGADLHLFRGIFYALAQNLFLLLPQMSGAATSIEAGKPRQSLNLGFNS